MQFLGNFWPNNRLAPPPWGLAPPPLGNPGSATIIHPNVYWKACSSSIFLTESLKNVFLQPTTLFTLGDPGFSQGGGPRNFCRDFADVVKWSQVSGVSQYWLESRAQLRTLEALAFLTVKYAFSHLFWYLFFKKFNLQFWRHITKFLFQYKRF